MCAPSFAETGLRVPAGGGGWGRGAEHLISPAAPGPAPREGWRRVLVRAPRPPSRKSHRLAWGPRKSRRSREGVSPRSAAGVGWGEKRPRRCWRFRYRLPSGSGKVEAAKMRQEPPRDGVHRGRTRTEPEPARTEEAGG